MKLIIHRGTHQIGGSCIEVSSGNTRLILDAGSPLDADPEVMKTSPERYRPAVKGLFAGSEPPLVDAVLLSHSHPDHSRFLSDIHLDIPIYMSEGTRTIIQALSLFLSQRMLTDNVKILKTSPPTPVRIGDFLIEPVPVDHSSPDALAFILQSKGKTCVYSGDFRAHGRKTKLFDGLIERCPRPVDTLLLEGTMVGSHRDAALCPSEQDLEEDIVKRIQAERVWPILVNFSPTNLDRVISFIQACVRTKTELVIDLFTAYLYSQFLKSGWQIPALDKTLVRVLYFRGHAKAIEKAGQVKFLYKMKARKIEFKELADGGKRVVLFRPSHLYNHTRHDMAFKDALFFQSQYEGVYPGQEEMMERFQAYIQQHGIRKVPLHTSGHAFEKDLKRCVEALKPKIIIPIHTFHPEEYSGLFPGYPVKQLNDGEPYEDC
jgi:ribonuclease J